MSPAHAEGAAPVVTQLLAFLEAPPRYRGELGARASLESGHHIFRFAQGRFTAEAVREMEGHEPEELRRAAVAFIREVCLREGATHYQALCVPADASREAIKENYHLLMALIHPDRAEGGHEAWPSCCAQRANRAYAVLYDDAARASYDKSSARAPSSPPPPRHPYRRMARKRTRLKARVAAALLAVGGIACALLLGEAWVGEFGDTQFAFTGKGGGRDVALGAERPRFLGTNITPARDDGGDTPGASREAERFTMREPAWRSVSPALALAPAREKVDPGPASPVTSARPAPGARPEREPSPPPEAARIASPEGPEQPKAPPQGPAQGALTSAQIEIVVARLVGAYEAGEADGVMALVDEGGAARAARTREAYLDFFRSTRERRLRVKRLEWQTAAASARAQGEATVQAEYVDAPGGLDRDVAVDLEIGLKDGQPKITRLGLFPNVP